MVEPPNTLWQGSSVRPEDGRVPRRWLTLARGAWIVCALLLLANFVASIPAYDQIMRTVCTLPNHVPCTMPGQVANTSAQLTPDNVAALAHLHLSLATYAASVVTLDVVLSLLYWGVGLLLFWRKSDEGMGLFVSLLLVLYGGIGIQGFFLGAYTPTPSPLLLQILLFLISGAQWTGLFLFLLVFPTGRFVPRWSWLVILLSVLSFLVFNPALFPAWAPVLNAPVVSAGVNLLGLGGPLAIMVYRYVRVFDAVQRQQVKWFVYAVAAGLALGVIVAALPSVTPAGSPFQLLRAMSGPLALAFIPLGLGVAILRYRLWDIDVIINRTLVYGSLTALLVLLYVGLILGLQSLFQGVFKQNNDVAIVVSTLVIAALFQPLPYKSLQWMLAHDLDLADLQREIYEQPGKRSLSSSSVSQDIPTSLTYLLYEEGQNCRVIVSFASQTPESLAKVRLIHDAGLDGPFSWAHECFSVRTILSILRGEVPYRDIVQLIEEACTP